ncbi:MAG: GGDEF domain-containing protein, partial [Nitrospinales bacterium]
MKVAKLAADSIIVCDKAKKIIFFNQQAEKTFGYTSDEMIGQPLNILIPSQYHNQHDKDVHRFANSSETARLMNEKGNVEIQGVRRNGSLFTAETSILKIQLQEEIALVAILRDITKRKELEQKLKFFAERDSLTGLWNRRIIEELSKKELERASRYQRNLSLLLIDIDNFKKINDRYGHDIGDLALKHFATISINNLRQADLVGRWGGEEFVVLLPEIDANGASVVAEKLRAGIEQNPLELDGQEKISFTISLGGAEYNKSMSSWENFIKHADKALYQAKSQGKNRFCLV